MCSADELQRKFFRKIQILMTLSVRDKAKVNANP